MTQLMEVAPLSVEIGVSALSWLEEASRRRELPAGEEWRSISHGRKYVGSYMIWNHYNSSHAETCGASRRYGKMDVLPLLTPYCE